MVKKLLKHYTMFLCCKNLHNYYFCVPHEQLFGYVFALYNKLIISAMVTDKHFKKVLALIKLCFINYNDLTSIYEQTV